MVLRRIRTEWNPVRTEYMLMEEAKGTQLSEIWDDIELESKLKIVDEVIEIQSKFLSAPLAQYGNLYFADQSPPEAKSAELLGDVSESTKEKVKEKFAIGRATRPAVKTSQRYSMVANRGPFRFIAPRHISQALLIFLRDTPF
jgi:hypothetical protein